MIPQSAPAKESVLVVEDDPDIREMIVAQLSSEQYRTLAAGGLVEARSVMTTNAVDLVVLDLNLPDGDGRDLCRELRSDGFDGAIIMVTARDAAIDRVLGLELGADDYLTKPFEPRELVVRIRNWLRRLRAKAGGRPRTATVARFGPWRLDLHQRRLIGRDDRLVLLSSAEYRLLTRLMESPDRVLKREELLPERSATVAFDRSIDLQISRLRQKLAAEEGGDNVILTVRSEGYVMPGPVTFE